MSQPTREEELREFITQAETLLRNSGDPHIQKGIKENLDEACKELHELLHLERATELEKSLAEGTWETIAGSTCTDGTERKLQQKVGSNQRRYSDWKDGKCVRIIPARDADPGIASAEAVAHIERETEKIFSRSFGKVPGIDAGDIGLGISEIKTKPMCMNDIRKELHDPVNHPRHYTQHPSGVECITVTRHMNFNIGNAVKYLWRSDLKNGLEDLKKARWYIDDEIARTEKEECKLK